MQHLTSPLRRTLFAAVLTAVLPLAALAQKAPQVRVQTSAGDFVLELYPDKAPQTVQNFLQYVKDKHYDGTIFHRVIPNFMVQGGGMLPTMAEKSTRAPIPLEARNGLLNTRGTVAMARTANPNSATAQFFINVVDNPFLNAGTSDGYAVFGKVVSGMETIDKIRRTPTGSRGIHQDVPLTPITIHSATLAP